MFVCLFVYSSKSEPLCHLAGVEEVGSQGTEWAHPRPATGQCTHSPGPVPGHWWEGEPTLTCQETRCQTHGHVQAECPAADEHHVDPRNDKAKMVTLRYQAADVVGTKSTASMSSDTVGKGHQENNVLFLVVHFPAKPC